jgi:hypothetical protein
MPFSTSPGSALALALLADLDIVCSIARRFRSAGSHTMQQVHCLQCLQQAQVAAGSGASGGSRWQQVAVPWGEPVHPITLSVYLLVCQCEESDLGLHNCQDT